MGLNFLKLKYNISMPSHETFVIYVGLETISLIIWIIQKGQTHPMKLQKRSSVG